MLTHGGKDRRIAELEAALAATQADLAVAEGLLNEANQQIASLLKTQAPPAKRKSVAAKAVPVMPCVPVICNRSDTLHQMGWMVR